MCAHYHSNECLSYQESALVALHTEGRLFIAALDISHGDGAVMAVNPDGSNLRTIIPSEATYMPNDLVFDAKGGFYVTDFEGAATEPKGVNTD